MTKKSYAFAGLIAAASLMVALAIVNVSDAPRGAHARPNILLILVDDLGYNDLASWGDGSAPTPQLDQLSRSSLRFTRYYADSTCSPSRAALMTGEHPVSLGFQPIAAGLSRDVGTVSQALSQAGYFTAHIGKWHIGEMIDNPEILPNALGFQYFFGFINQFMLQGRLQDGRRIQSQPTYVDPWLQENNKRPEQHLGSLDDILVQRAVDIITTQDAPWFINLWLMSPHTPYQPSGEFSRKYPSTPEGRYLAVLDQLDSNVGKLLKALVKSKQLENTVVVFLSDNGNIERIRRNNYPLSGDKGTYFEGGVRVPFFIYWPSKYSSRDVKDVASVLDIYPTLLGIAGVRPNKFLDGRDLLGAVDWMDRAHASSGKYFFSMQYEPFTTAFSIYDYGRSSAFHYGVSGSSVRTLFNAEAPVFAKGYSMSEAEYIKAYTAWEGKVRPLKLSYAKATPNASGVLTGRDLQRSPVFGEYSIGVGFRVNKIGSAIEGSLFHQDGLWSLVVDRDRRLRLQYAEAEIYSKEIYPVSGCNSLVVSLYVRPETHGFMATKPASRSIVYLNGEAVIDSDLPLIPPDQDYQYLANPTYVGGDKRGRDFGENLSEPVVVGKMLGNNQVGYGLADLSRRVCEE